MSRYIDADMFKEWYAKNIIHDDAFDNLVDIQPTADVRENKHGEWIKIHWKAFRCSACKGISEYYTDFCPNCGADMQTKEGEKGG